MLEGLGPQQGTFYDHPYFGQIFLGTLFSIIGYPDLGVPSMPASVRDLEGSIETLYTIPRILMGILAVVDTFLIYKIAERRYNRNVAFIAAILFAVTPLGWLFRRMYLRSNPTTFSLNFHTLCSIHWCQSKTKRAREKCSGKIKRRNRKDK